MMDDFLYGSARIAALENRICGKDRLERLLDAGDLQKCIALLGEFGVELRYDPENQTFLREETLSNRLRECYREVESVASSRALELWKYPYDCNNIKSAIKCRHRGIDCGGMLFDFGTVSLEDIRKYFETADEKILPEIWRKAAKDADETFSKTGNPQLVDLILDACCYASMKQAAVASGVRFAVDLVEKKIDFVNLLICIRLLRMGGGNAQKAMLDSAFLEGGSIDRNTINFYFSIGESEMFGKLAYSDYRNFALQVGGSGESLTKIERVADDLWMEKIREARLIPYGAEPLTAYLLGAENEVRNLRIILAGYEAGLPAKTVRERIRMSYV